MEGGQKIHVVNYLSARITCTDCIDFAEEEATEDCEICKTEKGIVERMKDWSEADGDDAVAEFVEWILRAWSNEFKTYIWAHNASRFDGHFILKYLGETKRRPDVMMNGLKLFEFRVQHTRQHSSLTWRDSYLLMPIRLEELKKTFALACEDKPFFPYGFNRRYDENEFTPFFLPDELRDYCRNDTEILQKALIEFRRILMRDVTNGFDILPISCTIARAQFMPEALLARVPEAGYERNDRASVLAIKYLDWRSKVEDDKLVDGKTCRELNEASQDRLRQLREAESGGQCLHPAKDEKISVFDIVSLYPWVNYDTEYPVGIPEIIRPGPEQMLVDWTRPEQLLYRGIYRVRVIPPRGLRIPIEASGFPGGVETREQKQQFIEEYLRVYSVTLEIERISKNPGLRFIAKLMLNSLWGKFSMRNELGSNRVISNNKNDDQEDEDVVDFERDSMDEIQQKVERAEQKMAKVIMEEDSSDASSEDAEIEETDVEESEQSGDESEAFGEDPKECEERMGKREA
uniref:DNA-directed DNA polymerase n=1 Tax=Globodera pallida TaxID=36090 RepID=A0A183C0C2_GLOPA